LLGDDVLGVPIWPVRVSLAGAFFVFTVTGLCTSKRVRQIAHRIERRRRGIDSAWKAGRDFLEQPAVSVGIFERNKRIVGATLRVAPGDARLLQRVIKWAAGLVEDLTHVHAAADRLVAGGVDVVHGED
jgi:hypothetical protein